MSDPIQLLNTKVEIGSTYGTAKVITGISKASEAVVTSVAHGFLVNDLIVIDDVVGMSQINRRVIRVKSVLTDSFVCEGLDSTGFTTWASGGTATKVTSFIAFDTLTNFDFPEPQPNPEDVTTIHDFEAKEIFGLDSAPSATMNTHAIPTNAALQEVRKASISKTDRVLRITFQNGNVMIVNTKLAGGRGISGDAGAVATGQVFLRFRATEQVFAA